MHYHIFLLILMFGGVSLTTPANNIPTTESERLTHGDLKRRALILTQVIFRHGDRTPTVDYRKDPHVDYLKNYGVEGFGELTPIGAKQAYGLGLYLRERYGALLGRSYSYNKINVQSSDYDRTESTALSALQGMYSNRILTVKTSPGNDCSFWDAIPVHDISQSIDNKIANSQNCNKYNQLYENYVNSATLQALNAQNSDFYQFLSHWTGDNITSFEDVYHIYSVLFIHLQHGIPLPAWAENGVYQLMKPFFDLYFTSLTPTEEMRRLTSGPLLFEIVSKMQTLTTFKAYFYSGHDTTISGLLDTLGVYDSNSPPAYVSALMFELFRVGNSIQIEVFYRHDTTGYTTKLNLPNCHEPCTLEKFESGYGAYLLNDTVWNSECLN